MSKFGISFVIESKHLGSLLEVLQPYKVENLDFKLVAGTPKANGVKPGDKFSWEIVATVADDTPRPVSHFKEVLLKRGWKLGTVYNAVSVAAKRGALKATKKNGVLYYTKTENRA